jgi:hypothetical protein
VTTAREMMHPGATCIGEDETLDAAARMMRLGGSSEEKHHERKDTGRGPSNIRTHIRPLYSLAGD